MTTTTPKHTHKIVICYFHELTLTIKQTFRALNMSSGMQLRKSAVDDDFPCLGYYASTNKRCAFYLATIAPHFILPTMHYCCSDDDESSFLRCVSKWNYFAFFPWLVALVLFLVPTVNVSSQCTFFFIRT